MQDNINKDTEEKVTNEPKENIEEVNESSVVDDFFMEDIYKNNYIDLYKLEGLDIKDQSKIFTLLLTNIYKDYSDIDYGNIRKYSLKCLKLSCDPEENELKLPYKLLVTKDTNRMYFKFEKDKTMLLFFIVLGLFIAIAIAATYFGLRYLSLEHLNIDINGDGIADINIDVSGNEKAEINISEDRKTPIRNIDYRGNRKPTFNVDDTGSGKATKNLMNQDTDGDGKCDLNCDTTGDGWPDLNIDIDGDGKCDLYCDTDGDGKPNLNFDTDGDGKCDLHCDTDGDNICDVNCVSNVKAVEDITGNSSVVGNSATDVTTAQFVVDFIDSKEIRAENLFPDDQDDKDVTKHVTKTFTIDNKSPINVVYRIELVVNKNTFTSENFVYNMKSTNNGLTKDFEMVPKKTADIADRVLITPNSKQTYTLTFKLKGIGKKQNFDQGKSFQGYLQVYVYEQGH